MGMSKNHTTKKRRRVLCPRVKHVLVLSLHIEPKTKAKGFVAETSKTVSLPTMKPVQYWPLSAEELMTPQKNKKARLQFVDAHSD